MSQECVRSDKELQGVEACLRALRLLSYVRLPFARYLSAVRGYAISKVASGWLSRWPALQLSKRISAAVDVGFRRVRSAAPWSHAALFGGAMHLDVLFATCLVGCRGVCLLGFWLVGRRRTRLRPGSVGEVGPETGPGCGVI